MNASKMILAVREYLEKKGFPFQVIDEGPYYEFVLQEKLEHRILIRCNKRNERTRIVSWIPVDKSIIKEKWDRVQDACNITMQDIDFQAIAFEDGIAIRYFIPDGCLPVIDVLLSELLYELYQGFYLEVFEKAINTDEDLYAYFENIREERIAKIKEKFGD